MFVGLDARRVSPLSNVEPNSPFGVLKSLDMEFFSLRFILLRRILFPPRKLTLQRPKPSCQSLLARRTEAIALLFVYDLHAVEFGSRYRVDLHGVDHVGQGDDEAGGVFLFVLVECEVLGAKHGPQLFPLSDAPF